jgi:hypothetical protein
VLKRLRKEGVETRSDAAPVAAKRWGEPSSVKADETLSASPHSRQILVHYDCAQ